MGRMMMGANSTTVPHINVRALAEDLDTILFLVMSYCRIHIVVFILSFTFLISNFIVALLTERECDDGCRG